MFLCLRILLGHSNSGILRVIITRKVVVHVPARRAERLSLFPLSPFLICDYDNNNISKAPPPPSDVAVGNLSLRK